MAFNAVMIGQERFDPYPYILLNLVLSCLAAIQAPIIMMSQKRQEAKDRLRSENDYRVNLKAELEIRHLHEKVDHILNPAMGAPGGNPADPVGDDESRPLLLEKQIASGLGRLPLLVLWIQAKGRLLSLNLRCKSFGALSPPAGGDNHSLPAHHQSRVFHHGA